MLIFAPTNADMAKLVDVPDLGSGAARRVGSSPIIRTKKSFSFEKLFLFQDYYEIVFTSILIDFLFFCANFYIKFCVFV